MKKLVKLMALVTALTFCLGMTVFAAEYDSSEAQKQETNEFGDGDTTGNHNVDKDKNNVTTDESTYDDEGNEDESKGDIVDVDGVEDTDTEESAAGGKASPQTSASIAPIVAMAGIAAAGAAAALKRK